MSNRKRFLVATACLTKVIRAAEWCDGRERPAITERRKCRHTKIVRTSS